MSCLSLLFKTTKQINVLSLMREALSMLIIMHVNNRVLSHKLFGIEKNGPSRIGVRNCVLAFLLCCVRTLEGATRVGDEHLALKNTLRYPVYYLRVPLVNTLRVRIVFLDIEPHRFRWGRGSAYD